jgi:hypothetical protein
MNQKKGHPMGNFSLCSLFKLALRNSSQATQKVLALSGLDINAQDCPYGILVQV